MKVVADIRIPYIEGVLEPFAEVVYKEGAEIGSADVRDADALLIRTRTRCDAGLLDGSSVKFIATATIGDDHIDKEYCRDHGIRVVNAAGCNAGGVLQWVAAVLVRLSEKQGWMPCEKTVGVVGMGNTGSLAARYAESWGFRVLRSDPPRETGEGLGRSEGYVPFDELAARSDIVTFHVPLIKVGKYPTYDMAGEHFFGLLKKDAAVLNSSRGGVINETILKSAVKELRCLCCLDTWAGEPMIDKELLAVAALATPHIAGYTAQGKANASAVVINAVAGYFSLALSGWYPAQVKRVGRMPVSWEELCGTVKEYFDIEAQSKALKAAPDKFEQFRNNYIFREEYF